MARIEAALARIDAACTKIPAQSAGESPNVMSLVNKHEALREEVAVTIRELDKLIADLDG